MKIPRDKQASSDPGTNRRSSVRIGSRHIPLPGTRRQRMILGTGLVIGGVLGFLPVVGFWMLPLGLLVLSVDSAAVRRRRRRWEVQFGRWRKRRQETP